MKFKKILLITLLLLTVFTISVVSAADNLTDEGVLQDTSSEEIELSDDDIISSSEEGIISATDNGTFTALQNKINDASNGSTIILENDYFYDDGFDTEGIKITKSLIINGNGHTINGMDKSRIFFLTFSKYGADEHHNLVLKNIIFSNGHATGYYEYGGAIDTNFYERFQDGKFIFCSWSMDIKNCTFINNKVEEAGGAINNRGTMTLTHCIFTNNKAKYGGAIINDANLKVINCEFTNNYAYNGGAIDNQIPNTWVDNILTVKDSKFINNEARDEGGAIQSAFTNYETIVTNSIFTNNKAGEKGGAMYVAGEANGCTFTKNQAPEGKDTYLTTTINCIFDTPSDSSQSSSSNPPITTKTTKTTPKLTAKKATFKVKTKIKKYTATLKTNKNKAMKKIKLYLKVKGKTYTAKTNNNGKVTFNIKNLMKKGTYKTTITFKGNKNYNKVTKTVKIIVK